MWLLCCLTMPKNTVNYYKKSSLFSRCLHYSRRPARKKWYLFLMFAIKITYADTLFLLNLSATKLKIPGFFVDYLYQQVLMFGHVCWSYFKFFYRMSIKALFFVEDNVTEYNLTRLNESKLSWHRGTTLACFQLNSCRRVVTWLWHTPYWGMLARID